MRKIRQGMSKGKRREREKEKEKERSIVMDNYRDDVGMDGDRECSNDDNTLSIEEQVYTLVSSIPKGMVSTYKDVAVALGRPDISRLIGRILSRNPDPIVVPCHRVVMSDGSIGGYIYGADVKEELLRREGVMVEDGVIKDFKYVRFSFRS